MKLIALTEVVVPPNRQRRSFPADKMQEFSDNIGKTQLQNAIVLREVCNPINAGVAAPPSQLVLVSGERRLRAVTDLADLGLTIKHDGATVPLGFIPYTLLTDLDPLAAEEAELDENIQRSDLSFQELAAAVARLADLRSRQAVAAGLAPPTTADISLEVRGSSAGSNSETVRRQLIVARHLNEPEVAGAKSLDEAWKNLKRKDATERNRQLGDSVGRIFTAELHRARNEDSVAWLDQAEADQFDVILTDPPYGMGADEFGDSGRMNMAAHGYKDDEDTFQYCMGGLYRNALRVAKPQAHLYCFCDIDRFHEIREAFRAAGWTVFRTPLIWHKPNGARAPWPESGPHRKWECILYAKKGDKPTLFLRSDVLSYSNEAGQEHGAQKPVALYQDLLERSCRPGDSVADFFCGSGTIFAAAHALKCRASGWEKSQASYGIAVRRIEALKDQLELVL